jgi:hypothetical protein
MRSPEQTHMAKRAALLLFLILCAVNAGAQSILTFAGGGTLDGQLVSDVPTNGPRGIAIDKAGNVYFVVRYAGQVLEVGRHDLFL